MSPSMRMLRRDQPSGSSGTTSFFLADGAPLIQYSTLSGGTGSAWTAGYARQADGFDETLHLTTIDNSGLSFNLTASSLTLLIPSFKDCKSTLSINGSSPISACSTATSSGDIPFSIYNLPLGSHNVQYNTGVVSNQQVIFWGIDATRPNPPNGYNNVTIDDTFMNGGGASLSYNGAWDHSPQGGTTDISNKFNKTISVTKTQGAQMTFTGKGSAVYLYGTMGPDYGQASLALNGQTVVPSMNLTSPWEMNYELLWYRTGLDATQPNIVTMTNLGTSKMSLDFLILTADPSVVSQLDPTTSGGFLTTLAGKLVVFMAVPVIAVLALAALAFFIIRNRRRRSSSRRNTISTTAPMDQQTPYEDKRTSHFSSVSGPGSDEVFVSYDEALGQRMSDRWNSSSGGGSQSSVSPVPTLTRNVGSPSSSNYRNYPHQNNRHLMPTLPESNISSPTSSSARGSWGAPFRSLLGNLPSPSGLPAYTPSESTDSHYPAATVTSRGGGGAMSDKSGALGGYNSDDGHTDTATINTEITPTRVNPLTGRRTRPPVPSFAASTEAPSDIMSVYGVAPLSARPDESTDQMGRPFSVPYSVYTNGEDDPPKSSPSRPPVPGIASGWTNSGNTKDIQSPRTPGSATSPPSAFNGRLTAGSGVSAGLGGEGNRSTTALSTYSGRSEYGARPDSDIIPFEDFVAEREGNKGVGS